MHIFLEAFTVTECNKIFLDRQPYQVVQISQYFRDWLHLHR